MRATWATTVILDCRTIEPTVRGLLDALAAATGSAEEELGAIAARLASLDGTTVLLALDHFEVLRLMDTWLRQVLLPSLDARVRVILSGREAPAVAWFGAGWAGVFGSIALGPFGG